MLQSFLESIFFFEFCERIVKDFIRYAEEGAITASISKNGAS